MHCCSSCHSPPQVQRPRRALLRRSGSSRLRSLRRVVDTETRLRVEEMECPCVDGRFDLVTGLYARARVETSDDNGLAFLDTDLGLAADAGVVRKLARLFRLCF